LRILVAPVSGSTSTSQNIALSPGA